jgi:hypothetical protein
MIIALDLFVLALLWIVGIVAVCCICAVGGAADDRIEEWYAEHTPPEQPASKAEKGAA